MNLSFLPPEVNSALVYAAPGSEKLDAAAAQWDCLAMGLHTTAVSYRTVVAELITKWPGPSAIGMAGAAAHYAWRISTMAAGAADVGAKAKTAAKTFGTAYARTVPPLVIAANRAWFATLAATNLLGQNSQAIAATETHYLEMWAQDATALNGYVASYHTAVKASVSAEPAAGPARRDGTVSIADGTTVSALSTNPRNETRWALSSLTAPGSLPGTFGPSALPGEVGAVSAPERLAMYPISMLAQAAHMCQTGAPELTANSHGLLNGFGQLVDCTAQLVVDGATDRPLSWEANVSARMAHATSLGELSIPSAWPAAAPAIHAGPASGPNGSRSSTASSMRGKAAQLTLIELLAAGPWAPPPAQYPPK